MPPDISLYELMQANGTAYAGMFISWVAVALAVISAVLSVALQPGPPKPPKPASFDDFELPTADAGRPVPLVFGTVWVKSPNVVWYGDLTWDAIRKEGFTVGYHYYLGMHLVICLEADELVEIAYGERQCWAGSVTSNTTITIAAGGLFGGDEGEGGISGEMQIRFGGPAQGTSSYLEGISPTGVGHRGVVSVVCKHMYWGTSKYIKPLAFKVRNNPGKYYSAGSILPWYAAKALVDGQANPAHIIFSALTNADWGLGYSTGMINSYWFEQAANALYSEGLGLGFIWVQQDSIESFVQQVMDHISGVLRLDPESGLFAIKLIRADYSVGLLDVLDESNIVELQSFQRVGLGDTVNEVVLKWRKPLGREQAVTVQNIANWQAQGRLVSETVDYPGCRSLPLARKLAARDLRIKSGCLAALRVTTNRFGFHLLPGDVFIFRWAALGIDGLIMRVGEQRGGTLLDGKIEITAVEDVFGLGRQIWSDEDVDDWVAPDPVPDPSTLDPPADPTALSGTSGSGQINWAWTPGDLAAYSELWVATTNDRATATRLVKAVAVSHVQAVSGGTTWYGWVRSVDADWRYSEWFPASATGGVASV